MHDPQPYENEFGSTIASLDRLGQADRVEPSLDFETRIAHATRPGVAATITPARTSRVARALWAIPIAAAVILGVFIIRPTQPTTVQPEQTTMAMLESEFADFVFIDALATERSVVIELTTETTGTQDSTDEILFDIFGLEGSSL